MKLKNQTSASLGTNELEVPFGATLSETVNLARGLEVAEEFCDVLASLDFKTSITLFLEIFEEERDFFRQEIFYGFLRVLPRGDLTAVDSKKCAEVIRDYAGNKPGSDWLRKVSEHTEAVIRQSVVGTAEWLDKRAQPFAGDLAELKALSHQILAALVESLVVLLISSPDCYSAEVIFENPSSRPLVSLLQSLHRAATTSLALQQIQKESEVSSFVFHLAQQADELLQRRGRWDRDDGEEGAPRKIQKLHLYDNSDSLATDVQSLALQCGGEHLLPFSLQMVGPDGKRLPKTLLRIRSWLCDNFVFDYPHRLQFLLCLLKHWEEFGERGGREDVRQALGSRPDWEALTVIFQWFHVGGLSAESRKFFVGCFQDNWAKLPLEDQLSARETLFAEPEARNLRWIFQSENLSLADIGVEEALTTGFNKLTLQQEQGPGKYEEKSFFLIHWCAFVCPQRVMQKIVDEGVRNKGQQAILVGLLRQIRGLSLFRFQGEKHRLLTSAFQEKLAQAEAGSLSGGEERNFRTMVAILAKENGAQKLRFIDDEEILLDVCLPNLQVPPSAARSLALDITYQFSQQPLAQTLWKLAPKFVIAMVELLRSRQTLRAEEVDVTFACISAFTAAWEAEVERSFDLAAAKAAMITLVLAFLDFLGVLDWPIRLHFWPFLSSVTSKLGMSPPVLPFPGSVLEYVESDEGLPAFVRDLLLIARCAPKFLDLALRRWPVSEGYGKHALRKIFVAQLASVLPGSSPIETARLVAVLSKQLFGGGWISTTATSEGLFTLLLFAEVLQQLLALKPAQEAASGAVRQVTLHLKPQLAALQETEFITAFAVLCSLVEKSKETPEGDQLYNLSLDFLTFVSKKLATLAADGGQAESLRETVVEGLSLSVNLLSTPDRKASFHLKIRELREGKV